MNLMLGEVVVIAFCLGGVFGAAMALHLKAASEKKPHNSGENKS